MSRSPNYSPYSGDIEDRVKMHTAVIIGVVTVVVIGFAALLITAGAMVNDSLAEKKAVYLDLRDKVKDQNDKIDQLTKELQKQKAITSQ